MDTGSRFSNEISDSGKIGFRYDSN